MPTTDNQPEQLAGAREAAAADAGTKAEPKRIAIWANPRSLSTALLRSWGSRADVAAGRLLTMIASRALGRLARRL